MDLKCSEEKERGTLASPFSKPIVEYSEETERKKQEKIKRIRWVFVLLYEQKPTHRGQIKNLWKEVIP